jgi:hypothetical protein
MRTRQDLMNRSSYCIFAACFWFLDGIQKSLLYVCSSYSLANGFKNVLNSMKTTDLEVHVK